MLFNNIWIQFINNIMKSNKNKRIQKLNNNKYYNKNINNQILLCKNS